ncbi:MAG: 4-alpha-glucanotransferase [Chloroflexi bacterium]|nr:4-alpha-glucanotransferase [Chloroflexota bacterium]
MGDRIRGLESLRTLAKLDGVQTSYRDAAGQRRTATPETLVAILRAFGEPLHTAADAAAALRARQDVFRRQIIEPVTVVRTPGRPTSVAIRVPGAELPWGRWSGTIRLENGESQDLTAHLRGAAVVDGIPEPDGSEVRRFVLPPHLPLGYHTLRLEGPRAVAESTVIVAPRWLYGNDGKERDWGVFLPGYALRSERSIGGVGDVTDLAALVDWVGDLGGRVVGTLPLLATFLDDRPFDPSPYAPVSRLFWNELYLDPARVPYRRPATGGATDDDLNALRAGLASAQQNSRVEYRTIAKARRVFVQSCADRFFSGSGWETNGDFVQFLRDQPSAKDYARFRAATEKKGEPWTNWPSRAGGGELVESDYDRRAFQYHLFAQWQAAKQVSELASRAAHRDVALYFDMTIGTHAEGYDSWRYQQAFARGASAGAPPDTFFTGGQDWGLSPLHPQRIRDDGHHYFIACLRHQMRVARMLRIDHVMGLHRLWWVPEGMQSKDGAYVRYPAEELFAILALESHRNQSVVVGENLGTVPGYVNRSLVKNGVRTMYVAEYEATPREEAPLSAVPATVIASLNTHDMPPFAAYEAALDVDDRLDLGLMDEAMAMQERETRAKTLRSVANHLGVTPGAQPTTLLRPLLKFLGTSPAKTVLVNLEDLWGEILPQNVPGTMSERPNWQRKAKYSLSEFSDMPAVVDALGEIDQLRREPGTNTR